MNWRDLECQTINPCICNSLYRHLFLINHYCLFVCLISSTHITCTTMNLKSYCFHKTNDTYQQFRSHIPVKVIKYDLLPGGSLSLVLLLPEHNCEEKAQFHHFFWIPKSWIPISSKDIIHTFYMLVIELPLHFKSWSTVCKIPR